jgi:hypothetical protein
VIAVPSPLVLLFWVQLAGSIPEPASVQFQAIDTSLRYQPLLPAVPVTTGLSAGGVLSTLTVVDAVPLFPATSKHVALNGIEPSPEEVDEVVQSVGSIEFGSAAIQFHVTVTSVLFQPAAFGAGD